MQVSNLVCQLVRRHPVWHHGVMRVSAKSDYAIRTLLELAADPGVPKTCEAVAEIQQIPYRFLKSVLQELRRAGLVVGQRGCEGGYWLARDAAGITVADVVQAVDGEVFTVRGVRHDQLDYDGGAAHLGSLWTELSSRVHDVFKMSIADLLTTDAQQSALAPTP
jgi:Rrf2 family protein